MKRVIIVTLLKNQQNPSDIAPLNASLLRHLVLILLQVAVPNRIPHQVYSRILFSQTSKGSENWFEKLGIKLLRSISYKTKIGLRYREVWEIGVKIREKYIQEKRKLILEIRRFKKSKVISILKKNVNVYILDMNVNDENRFYLF